MGKTGEKDTRRSGFPPSYFLTLAPARFTRTRGGGGKFGALSSPAPPREGRGAGAGIFIQPQGDGLGSRPACLHKTHPGDLPLRPQNGQKRALKQENGSKNSPPVAPITENRSEYTLPPRERGFRWTQPPTPSSQPKKGPKIRDKTLRGGG